jgi:hypothetical protein
MMKVVTLKELFFEELNRQLQEEGRDVRVVSCPEIKTIEPEPEGLKLEQRRRDNAA